MTNKAKDAEIKITLDRERTIRFDFNAMCSYEAASGVSALSPGALTNLDARAVRTLLWACLVHEDDSLTVHDVGRMITATNLDSVAQALQLVVTHGMPASDPPKPRPKTARRTKTKRS